MRPITKSDELMAIFIIVLLLIYSILHTHIYVSTHMETEKQLKDQYNRWIENGHTNISFDEFKMNVNTSFDVTGGTMKERYNK